MDSSKKRPQPEGVEKKPYRPPELTSYGSLTRLTGSQNAGPLDALFGGTSASGFVPGDIGQHRTSNLTAGR